MSRASTKKLYRTFVQGLITEASPLTYPENASINEDNCIIYRKGNRSRRYGINLEPSYYTSAHQVDTASFDNYSYTEFVWDSVADRATINFLVHQVGLTLYFYDLSLNPVSSGLKSFTVNLSSFLAQGAVNTSSLRVSMSCGKGFLFVTSEQLEPFLVSYNPVLDTITSERIYIQIRDFKGVDDLLSNEEEPATLTDLHKYNLYNQGWERPYSERITDAATLSNVFSFFGKVTTRPAPKSTVIDAYKTATGRYPGNNKQWHIAKDDTGDFDPELLEKTFFGSTRAPRGHFVVNAFYIDRSAVSSIGGIPVESLTERPNTTSFYGGRVWYGINNTLYFSQMADDKRRVGMCYQEADPTSEAISDLIATDGGVIPIPEMGQVVRLVAQGSGLLVFANNGVWFVTGTSAGFSALDFSVSKVANVGTESPHSIVLTDDKVFYWSRVGIQAINQKSGMFGAVEGVFEKANITEDTIQTFFNEEVSPTAHKYVKGVYDLGTNTIQWLFRNDDEDSPWVYNRILNYDVTLKAFYPWSINSEGARIIGAFNTGITGVTPYFRSFSKFLVAFPTQGVTKFSVAVFNNENYCDWQFADGTGLAYESFVETGYELLEDAMRQKQANYVFCYLRRTEQNFVVSGDDYTTDKPSSCFFQVKWDWASSSISNKWTSKVQVYRHTRVPFVNPTDLEFDDGYAVVVSKNKVRGNGKSIQFRFENSAIGSNFDLLGWAVAYSGNTEV